MKVVQRINEILKDKQINKRELARRLINLDMKAHKTGETPTESSIYVYLNGNIEIKADMLPFIADALGVSEQDFYR
nr:helix-turn-helix domain-containing protein [uncultured Campylobacter sp.]